MCVAILQLSKTKQLTKSEFDDHARCNSDGYGLMYVDNGKLELYHTMDLGLFYKQYDEIYSKVNCESPIAIHFRAGTHGEKTEFNCHPFKVSDRLAFIHNGIISGFGSGNLSDTNDFNEKILKQIGDQFIFSEATQTLIMDLIGTYNKFIFLTRKKKYKILNEDKGEWVDEVWYSFKKAKAITTPYNSYSNTVPWITNTKTRKCFCCEKEIPMHGYNLAHLIFKGKSYHFCEECADTMFCYTS